jgi:outer membrane receptor for ferrienterochelin and colicins
MKLPVVTCLFCLTALFQNPAYSQYEENTFTEPTKSGEDLLFQDIPSVYTASKYEQKVTKAPASISIVTADEIKKWGYRSFSDILSSLKGFYASTDRNYGYVGTRGFGLPTDYNTRLLLLIDGHRYNDNLFESFYINEDFPVDIDMIERVEVVRGPSSSLYGSNAFFGVINVITKRGRDQQGANVKATYGSNNTYKTSASYGQRFSNGIEAFLTGTFYDSQGDSRFFSKEFKESSTNGIYVDNDEEESKRFMGKLAYGDFMLEGVYVDRIKAIPTASFETEFNDPRAGTDDESAFLYLNYNHTFDNQLNLQARVSYNKYRYTGDYPTDFSETENLTDVAVNKDIFRGQWWRAGLELTKVLFDDHRFTVGSEYQDNFEQFLTNFNTRPNGVVSDINTVDTSTDRWALFIQDEYTINSQFTFNAGVRYDYYSIFGGTINPRLALIYNPWEKTSIKLLYGTAFRAPSENEINTPSFDVIANNKLKPEQLETSEIILEHYFNQSLRGELNFFHTEVSDIIANVRVANERTQNQNVDNVTSNGFEVQFEDSWSNGFQGRISYSWQRTVYDTLDNRLPNSPEHLFKLNLIAPLWQDRVFIGFETQYLSSRKVPAKEVGGQTGKVNGYTISNVALFTQNWIKGLELSAGAYNLFDERYFDAGSPDHAQNGILRDGLTFRVKASLDF